MSPPPNRFHQEISRNIEFLLLKYLERNPVGELFHAPFAVYLGEHDVFEPDILFVANDRLSIVTEAGAEGAPTLVVEILSPSTASTDRNEKKAVYAARGVEEMWIVDPLAKAIEIHRLQDASGRPRLRVSGNGLFRSVCFPRLELRVRDIFRSRFEEVVPD